LRPLPFFNEIAAFFAFTTTGTFFLSAASDFFDESAAFLASGAFFGGSAAPFFGASGFFGASTFLVAFPEARY